MIFYLLIPSDVWSYGITLYELFTHGVVPYFSFTNTQTAEKVVNGYRLEKPKDCSDDVYTLMRACWEEDPSKRPSFSDIVDRIDPMIKQRQPPPKDAIFQIQYSKGAKIYWIKLMIVDVSPEYTLTTEVSATNYAT
jgi:serine/threonine protein kinase